MAASEPLASHGFAVQAITETGRDGVKNTPSTREKVSVKFVVRSPRSQREALLALFAEPTLTITETGVAGRSATGRLVASSVERHYPRADLYVDAFVVEIPGGAWRGNLETTPFQAPTSAGVTITLLSGLSAPVQDPIVRFRGPIKDPQLVDSSGAFVAVSREITGSEWLRFEAESGRAYVTTSDTWTGGTEVSGLVDYGGPRGVFELTPDFTTPETRVARATLTQSTFASGAGVQIRGRSAHLG